MSYLWGGARYRITGSDVSDSNGGSGMLIVESAVLRFRFVADRGRLMVDMQPAFLVSESWCQSDLVQRLLDNGGPRSGLLDPSFAFWLKNHLSEVEALFRRETWEATYAKVLEVQRIREREMWGPDVPEGASDEIRGPQGYR